VFGEKACALLDLLILDLVFDLLLDEFVFVLHRELAHGTLHTVRVEGNQVLGIVVLGIKGLNPINEHLMLVLTEELDERLSPVPKDLTLEGNVIVHLRKAFFVEVDEVVQGPLTDIERGKGWKEIISYEETKEDPVIDDPLQVKLNFHLLG